MQRRMKTHIHIYWPYCHYGGWYCHHLSPPPPPWWRGTMTADEEKENLREDIEMLKEELKAAEGRIKELENL